VQASRLLAQSNRPQMGARPAMATGYNVGPVVVFWEITRSCALACVHCRATARPKRHPLELTTQGSFELVDEIRRFEPNPILVISGGDPLMRPDLFEIATYASGPYGPEKRMRVSLSPSVTALVTPKNLRRVRESGISHLSFSLDGPDAASHDSFRGVAGSLGRTLTAVRDAQEAGLTVQLNTTVTRRNAGRLGELAAVVDQLGAVMWDVFFLVITGRAITIWRRDPARKNFRCEHFYFQTYTQISPLLKRFYSTRTACSTPHGFLATRSDTGRVHLPASVLCVILTHLRSPGITRKRRSAGCRPRTSTRWHARPSSGQRMPSMRTQRSTSQI